MNKQNKSAFKKEKLLSPISGMPVLIANILLLIASVILVIFCVVEIENAFSVMYLEGIIISITYLIVGPVLFAGLKVINPGEAAVYVLFGSYYGTIATPGFYFINPFCAVYNPSSETNGKVSTKAITLNNEKQKVNDREGNPIEIGVIVIWRVVNATKAVFEVDNYTCYVSTQTDASIRQVARQYPYDISEDGDEKSLRGSSTEVAEELKRELQSRIELAGVEIIEARIAHLAYAQEIAAAMLQRQQAAAIIAARQKIVEGAVGMVEMALEKLEINKVVKLDDERKAAMVSNLLVVLCGNKDAQPIVNSGSIY